MKSDKNLIFADIVYFGLIYPSEKKRENSNRGKSCPPRFVKGFCIEIKNNKARHKIWIVNTARWP